MIDDRQIEEALENEYDGTDMFLLVQEIFELKEQLLKHQWISVKAGLPKLFENISHPHSAELRLVYHKPGTKPYECQGMYEKERGWLVYTSLIDQKDYQDYITHYQKIVLPKE